MKSDFIRKAREQIFELRRRRAVEHRREKLDATESKTEMELYLDDVASEGIDVKDPANWPTIIRGWALKHGQPLDNDMERDHDDLSF
jgi:hypothetical protein